MTSPRLLDLRSQFIGKHVTISYGGQLFEGTIVDIEHSGRKLGRIGYPYVINLDSGFGVPGSPDSDIETFLE